MCVCVRILLLPLLGVCYYTLEFFSFNLIWKMKLNRLTVKHFASEDLSFTGVKLCTEHIMRTLEQFGSL